MADDTSVDVFMEAIRNHTSISGENLGAVRMAFAMVAAAREHALQDVTRRAALLNLQLSRHRANEDRLVAWLDEYMHEHALATDPDHDLAGAVIDVFRQQQTTIGLLKEALEAQKARVYKVLPPAPAPSNGVSAEGADAAPSTPPAGRKRGPYPVKLTDEELRQAVFAQMHKMQCNGWGPTQREWNNDTSHGLPTCKGICGRLNRSWTALIEEAGLKAVLAGMAIDYRPAEEQAPAEPALEQPTEPAPEPPALVAAARHKPINVTRRRTVLNASGEPETITTRRYTFSS